MITRTLSARRLKLWVVAGSFHTCAIMTDADPWLFITRPISGVLLGLSVASVVFALWQHRRAQARSAAKAVDAAEAADF